MNISSLTLDSNPISRTFSAANPRTQRSPFIRHRNVVVCSVKSVPSSPSLVAAPAGEGLNRIESLSQVSAVLGCQWGDEGKGKLVDILAKHFDIVARCQVYTLWVLGFGFWVCKTSPLNFILCYSIKFRNFLWKMWLRICMILITWRFVIFVR